MYLIDKTDDDIESFNVGKALKLYQTCFVPLYYHELWTEIVNDYMNVDIALKERETVINAELFYEKTTVDEEKKTALVFGTNRVVFSKFCLFHLMYH